MNICGCLVHVASDQIEAATRSISDASGAEIHASSDDGRLVVVVEDTEEASAADRIMALHQIPGVLSVTLNYHHFEAPPAARPQTSHLTSQEN